MDIKLAKVFGFELVDVINALIDVPPKAQYATMRVSDGGEYLEIEFVGPDTHAGAPADEQDEGAEDDDSFPGDKPSKYENEKSPEKPVDAETGVRMTEGSGQGAETQPAGQPGRSAGPNEERALKELKRKSFHLFLGAGDEAEARAKLLSECRSTDLAAFDRDRHKRALFLDIMGAFQAWLST